MEDVRYIGTLDAGHEYGFPARSRTGRPMTTNRVDGRDVPANVHHPDFNYMAYNTLRMYDEPVGVEECRNEPRGMQ